MSYQTETLAAETYLASLAPTREEVDLFLETDISPTRLSRNGGVTYHPEFGWLHAASAANHGVGGSKVFYSYEPDFARKVVNCADVSCRIHTYGDSFTHCDQVNDGETWQEYLAVHLQEPIRNYGVGGYSVYQAFLRMKHAESQRAARYIILNIFDGDHLRNLMSWFALNGSALVRGEGYMNAREDRYTRPYLRINVEQNSVTECPNQLPTPQDVYKLCDREWLIKTYRDDPILPIGLAIHNQQPVTTALVETIAASFGLTARLRHLPGVTKPRLHPRLFDPRLHVDGNDPTESLNLLYQEAMLFSTRYVIGQVEKLLTARGQKLLVVLTHGMGPTEQVLSGVPKWDQSLVDFLHDRGHPVLDMRDVFTRGYATSRLSPIEYLRPFYNSHHSPAGNFMIAWGIKDALVELLDPKPRSYR